VHKIPRLWADWGSVEFEYETNRKARRVFFLPKKGGRVPVQEKLPGASRNKGGPGVHRRQAGEEKKSQPRLFNKKKKKKKNYR